MVLPRPDVLHKALPRRHEVDGVNDRSELAQRVLDARIIDRRSFDRDLDVLRLLVDFIKCAADAVDAFEPRKSQRHLDERRLVRLQHVQDDPFDVGQQVAAPETASMGRFDNKRSESVTR